MKNWAKTTLILAICGLFGAWMAVCYASTPFDDGFEAYTLGDVAGQGIWTHRSSSGVYNVVDTEHYAGSKSLEATKGSTGRIDAMGGTDISAGTWTWWLKTTTTSGMNIILQSVDSNPELGCGNIFVGNHTSNKVSIYDMSGGYPIIDFDDMPLGEWWQLTIEWDWGTGNYRAKVNDGDWSGWVHMYNACWTGDPLPAGTGIQGVRLFTNGTASTFIDNIGNVVVPSEIYLTSPTTGSTITDDTTELVGGWTNIDSTTWTNIKIAFNDLQISETSGLVNVPITADDGTFSIPLSQFHIPNNGGWTLRAVVENNYEYNFDVPSPTYGLTFNISGLPTPYAFTDFESWYSENVSDYEEPSAWATAIVGFLNPIFEKIGQFGDRINYYLDVSTAYEKGNQIGSVFPVIGAYVLKIDLFFGGFPMVAFFKWGILLMIGLFAVKIILKLLSFIPFVGGGG